VAHNLDISTFHSIELFRQQANKILQVCDADLEKVMRLLDFKGDQLVIKNLEIIMSYEAFMPNKIKEIEAMWPRRKRADIKPRTTLPRG
jgi:hypothetical protein